MENKFIPCANGQQAQMECLYRIAGSLIEVNGFPIVHYTPQDARMAAQTLWAMADSIEGRKLPRSDSDAVRALIVAAENVVKDWEPRGIGDELIDVMKLKALDKALNTLTGDVE